MLKTVEEIQERIGAIHDCDVRVPLVERTLKKETNKEQRLAMKSRKGVPTFLAAEGLVPLLSKQRLERDRLYGEFIAFWDSLPPERLREALNRILHPPEEENALTS